MIDYNAIDDVSLYGMCAAGDEGAWQYVYNYIIAICKWRKWNLRDDPEEMAQEITLHLIEKSLRKVKKKDRFRNFVKTVAINKIKDSFKVSMLETEPLGRVKRSRKGEEFEMEHADPSQRHDAFIENLQILEIVERALDALSSACRRVVREYLNYKMGLYKDYRELSKVLKMPVPTVSSKVRRCLDKLLEMKEIRALKTV